jgi:hypothetical protein
MSVPETVGSSEVLGRAIFDSSKAKQAAKGLVPAKVFREKRGVRELSVDRLSLADEDALVHLHDAARDGQGFHGWATLKHGDASDMNRTVIAEKLPNNPWHAEIVLPPLPDHEEAQDEEQKAHSANLAKRANWKPRPAPPKAVLEL